MTRVSAELSDYQPHNNNGHRPVSPSALEVQPQVTEEADFRDTLGLFRRRALVIIGVAAAFIGYSALSILGQENQYAGSFQILIEPVNAENASLAAPNSELSAGRGRSTLDYPTQIAVLRSPDLINTALENLKPTYPDLSFGQISGSLTISRIRDTKILDVSFQSNAAATTQAVLDEMAKTYLQYSLNERQTYLRQGIQFVDRQLADLQGQVDELQNRLESFRQRNNLVDPEVQSTQISGRITELEQRRVELQQQIAGTVATASTLLDEDGIELALEKDPVYQQLVSRVRELDVKIAQELTRFRPDNPVILVLEQERNNLTPLLQEREAEFLEKRLAEGVLQTRALETQLGVVEETLSTLRGQFQRVPTLSREYNNIQRQLEITSASLTRFLETRQQLQVEAAQREIPWQLVKEPSVFTIAPDVARSLMTRVMMGIALGVGAAFLLDKLDPSYHSVGELQRKTKLPVLGVLPFNQQLFLEQTLGHGRQRRRKLLSRMRLWLVKTSAKFSKSMSAVALSLLDEYDTSAEFVEALRVFHTNLQMLKRSQPIHSLVISSAAPGDGKTTVALNLAQTAAALGQRVLLIDASLRSPQLHSVLELPNKVGLSTLLSTDLDLESTIQQVFPDQSLYVLTAGPVPTDPALALSSPHLKAIMNACHKAFDLVLIDAPAVVGLADAMLLAQHGNGLVMVVKLDQTDGRTLKQALDATRTLGTSLLGLVANGEKGHNLALRETTLDNLTDLAPADSEPEAALVAGTSGSAE
jgi:polysaccharide biosynthesis transport protein